MTNSVVIGRGIPPNHSQELPTTSLFDKVTSELSATFFPPSPEYPTLQALMTRAGISDFTELKQLSDEEFRELTRVHAQYTPLQHAIVWHERQQLLAGKHPSETPATLNRSFSSTRSLSSPLPPGVYNLESMSRQTDLTVQELIDLSQADFTTLSKDVLRNHTLHHARVFMEYTDANNHCKNGLLCLTSFTNLNSATTITSKRKLSSSGMPSLEELCCGAVGAVSTGGSDSFRAQSPPTTTRKWSELV